MFRRTTSRRPQPSAPSAATGFAVQPFIQPKLVVGPVDAPYEREADRVAEQVVQRVPGPLGISRVGVPAVQREDCMVDDCGACPVGVKHGRGEREEDEEEAQGPGAGFDPAGQPPRKRGRPSPPDEDEEVKRQPDASSRPAGATVAPGVEAAIQRAQGGGRPLPAPVRRPMEQAFGADFHLVRVHTDNGSDRLNRSLAARAFTTGRDIFFRQGEYRPQSRAGQRLLAHELSHVVQQGAAGEKVVQRQFQGPQGNNAMLADIVYPGHNYQLVDPVQPHTACGTQNRITTAGEKVNSEDSDAGYPTDFVTYRDGYSVPPGLVKDRNRKCAATRMHLINHRLDATKKVTQQNPNNIMLGTQRSNNPTHLHRVENPVLNAVKRYGSRKNLEYETAMKNAEETKDPAGKKALFWLDHKEPDPAGVRDYREVYLIDGKLADGYRLPAARQPGDTKGFGLTTEGYGPPHNYYHLWLVYTVQANYGHRPGYVDANINRERAANTDPAGKPIDANIDNNIKDFDNPWADHAFPPNFTCNATYFSATYKPWGQGSYRVESEAPLQIDSDL